MSSRTTRQARGEQSAEEKSTSSARRPEMATMRIARIFRCNSLCHLMSPKQRVNRQTAAPPVVPRREGTPTHRHTRQLAYPDYSSWEGPQSNLKLRTENGGGSLETGHVHVGPIQHHPISYQGDTTHDVFPELYSCEVPSKKIQHSPFTACWSSATTLLPGRCGSILDAVSEAGADNEMRDHSTRSLLTMQQGGVQMISF